VPDDPGSGARKADVPAQRLTSVTCSGRRPCRLLLLDTDIGVRATAPAWRCTENCCAHAKQERQGNRGFLRQVAFKECKSGSYCTMKHTRAKCVAYWSPVCRKLVGSSQTWHWGARCGAWAL